MDRGTGARCSVAMSGSGSRVENSLGRPISDWIVYGFNSSR